MLAAVCVALSAWIVTVRHMNLERAENLVQRLTKLRAKMAAFDDSLKLLEKDIAAVKLRASGLREFNKLIAPSLQNLSHPAPLLNVVPRRTAVPECVRDAAAVVLAFALDKACARWPGIEYELHLQIGVVGNSSTLLFPKDIIPEMCGPSGIEGMENTVSEQVPRVCALCAGTSSCDLYELYALTCTQTETVPVRCVAQPVR
jgi:hypothetical protein